MKRKHLDFSKSFRVAFANARAQAAEMVIAAGKSEGGPDNRHVGADQWLFVLAGAGVARVAGKRRSLRDGTLLLIERGEKHEIRNTGSAPLRTLNVYVPPAYDARGKPLRRGKAS